LIDANKKITELEDQLKKIKDAKWNLCWLWLYVLQ
jgi:hypothetical protein